MEDIHITIWDLAIYFTIANVVLGFLFGTFPLIAGIKYGNRKFAFIGFFGSIVGSALAGILLSYPLAAIFTWLIFRPAARPVETVENTSGDTASPAV